MQRNSSNSVWSMMSTSSNKAIVGCPPSSSTAHFPPPPYSAGDVEAPKTAKRESVQRAASIGSDSFDEAKFDARCCMGRLNIMISLGCIALVNLLLDVVCTVLSAEHAPTHYCFGAMLVVSLLCLCAVISGVQKERKKMIGYTALIAGMKAMFLTAMTAIAVIGVLDEYVSNALEVSPRLSALLGLLPLFIVMLVIQWKVSQDVMCLIALRDELYIISSPTTDSLKRTADDVFSRRVVVIGPELSKQLRDQLHRNHVQTSPHQRY